MKHMEFLVSSQRFVAFQQLAILLLAPVLISLLTYKHLSPSDNQGITGSCLINLMLTAAMGQHTV